MDGTGYTSNKQLMTVPSLHKPEWQIPRSTREDARNFPRRAELPPRFRCCLKTLARCVSTAPRQHRHQPSSLAPFNSRKPISIGNSSSQHHQFSKQVFIPNTHRRPLNQYRHMSSKATSVIDHVQSLARYLSSDRDPNLFDEVLCMMRLVCWEP